MLSQWFHRIGFWSMVTYMVGFVFGLLLMPWPNVSGFFLMIWLFSGCLAYPYMFAAVIIAAVAPKSTWTYAYYEKNLRALITAGSVISSR